MMYIWKHQFLTVSRIRNLIQRHYIKSLNVPNFPITIHGIHKNSDLYNEKWNTFFQNQMAKASEDKNTFVLHDGPPYANGNTHVGHALNKILKDIVIRDQLLNGRHVSFRPGWDCHGLPIEMKAKELHQDELLSAIGIRSRARKVAEKFIDLQKTSFKRWGVLGSWSDPYCTFDNDYIAKQIRAFGTLFQKGFIKRDLWPVYWSYATKTALAEAELEYNEEHESQTVFARLKLLRLSPALADSVSDSNCYLVVWTTTPWTLPGNKAVAYNPSLQYSLLKDKNGEYFIVLSKFKDTMERFLSSDVQTIKSFDGSALDGCIFAHPVLPGREGPLLGADFVTDKKGTGLVHVAPAHGRDDFLLGVTNRLDLTSVVDEDGRFTDEVIRDLQGLHVLTDGNEKVLSLLSAKGHTIHREVLIHSYPYDWRSKTPVITRSSEQWFLDTDALSEQTVTEYSKVNVFPSSMKSAMLPFISDRPQWCISRQRCWGVPIPVFFDREGAPIVDVEVIDHLASRITKEGCDFWWQESPAQLIPKNLQHKLNLAAEDLRKETDILDIWLDSGMSWHCGMKDSDTADVYLEGQDQFRGWFSSSLILSVALQGRSPYKSIVVHGFTTDEDGRKMSKSLGNVVDPDAVAEEMGVDLLRYWAASAGLSSRSQIGPSLLANFDGKLKALRNMFRFILGNLHDFTYNDRLPLSSLWLHDRHLLSLIASLHSTSHRCFAEHQPDQVLMALEHFSAFISNFYFTAVKDRLYCALPNDPGRRAAQTVLHDGLGALLCVVAPVLPHLAEEVFAKWRPDERRSFLEVAASGTLLEKEKMEFEDEERRAMETTMRVREAVAEWAVGKGKKSAAAVAVTICPEDEETLRALEHAQHHETSSTSALCEILRCSRVTLLPVNSLDKLSGEEVSAQGCSLRLEMLPKRLSCPRCRRATKTDAAEEVCGRCAAVLREVQRTT